LRLGVDLVALSFVQAAADIRTAQQLMQGAGRVVPIVAKIERPAAVQNLAEIVAAAQGVMVARGDLGLEMPLEQLPRVQKEIIRRCRMEGRPVIVATQVLESMRVEPRPTRAEVSDAARAVDEGADAIMLAGETAAGAFPLRAVETLDAVIRDAESAVDTAPQLVPTFDPIGSRHGRALCEAAVTLARAGQADAIIAVTREGKTAKLLSALRPRTRIVAATASTDVAGALVPFWGVIPVLTTERDPERLEHVLIDRNVVEPGVVAVFINVSADLTRVDENFVNVQKLG
jgi:pyruvate kinase